MIKQTVVYKTVAGCDIKLDILAERSQAAPAPVVVWLHGGALILGSRKNLSSRPLLRDLLLDAGFAVVAVDYRLAPETKLSEILKDLADAFAWIGVSGEEYGLDRRRIGVLGHSAGGYLALMSAFVVAPRPAAIVSFYGYGDIIGPWYTRPSPHYCKDPLVSGEEALGCVGRGTIAEPPEPNCRSRYYLYLRQQGLWPNEVTGQDPVAHAGRFSAWCPIRNVSESWPPTLLIHGTADTDVPYEQSSEMAQALSAVGASCQLITIPGGGHGFDRDVTSDDLARKVRSAAAQACLDAVDFLVREVADTEHY